MTKRGFLYVAIIAVLLVLWYVKRFQHDARIDANTVAETLAPDAKAKYVINEKTHELIEIEHGEGPTDKEIVRRRFLDRHASVEVLQDGSVRITSRSWGTEFAPFVGVAIDSEAHGRGAVGANLFYVKRWELGGGLTFAFRSPLDIRAFVHGSYNVWSNTSISLGIDNHKAVFVMASLKF